MESRKYEIKGMPTRQSKSVYRRYGGGKPLEDELNERLYNRVAVEQEQFRVWLLEQEPEDILSRAYEYVTREDILLSLEYNTLPIEQARALLKSPCPLEDIFKDYQKRETDYMQDIFATVQARAKHVILMEKERQEVR